MTDDELIEKVQTDFTPAEFDRLVALASIGASVMPRPIEECKMSGKWHFVFIPGHGYARAIWRETDWISHATGRIIVKATHAFPYDALPEPKVKP